MIKIRFIWNYIPIPVFILPRQATSMMPEKYGGFSLGIIVALRPKWKDDEGLIQHELTHIKQNLRTCLWSGIKQNWSKQHRLDRECEAYAVQLSYSSDRDLVRHKKLFIGFMQDKYNLGMTKPVIAANFDKWILRIL